MKKSLTLIMIIVLAALIFMPLHDMQASAATPDDPEAAYASDELIVKFKPGTKGDAHKSDQALQNAQEKAFIKELDVAIIKLPKGQTPKDAADKLKQNPNIIYAEPNYEGVCDAIPNDMFYLGRQQQIPYLNAPAGWDILKSSSVLVAVVDTGIAPHPDLPTMMGGYNFIAGNTDTTDSYGHGTKVAGALGALGNNGVGITGINWKANILPVKISDTGSCYASNVAQGIIYAANNGARVINLSLGYSVDSSVMRDAINYAYNKGCVIIAATGNDSAANVQYPAVYDNVLAVGGTSNGTERFSNSNYGQGLDVLGWYSFYTTMIPNAYGNAAGTSLSTPQVAGLASLILGLQPNATPAEVYDLIRKGAKDLGAAGWDAETGYGLIDIGKTLALAKGGTSATVAPTPTATAKPTTAPTATPAPTAVETQVPATTAPTIPVEPAIPAGASVPDTTAPVLVLKGPASFVLGTGAPYIEYGASASDNIDGDVSSQINVSGMIDTLKPGAYELVYQVTDKAGNNATAKRAVQINEPVITVENKKLTFNGSVGSKASSSVTHDVSAGVNGNIEATVSFSGKNIGIMASIEEKNGTVLQSKQGTETFTVKATDVYAGDYVLRIVPVGNFNKANYNITAYVPNTQLITVPGQTPYGVVRDYKVLAITILTVAVVILLLGILVLLNIVRKMKRTA